MENASKALIIAGSVLLAIMLVAMGVTIFTRARNSADTTTLDATEISMFNQKFERFAGDNQSGSNVKSLLSFAISNASTNKDEPSKLPAISWAFWNGYSEIPGISMSSTNASSNIQDYINQISSCKNQIVSTKKYKVSTNYGTNGLITSVEIKEIH